MRIKALNWYKTQTKYRQFVMNVAPASGKTKAACVITSDLYKNKLIEKTIVIAPLTGVTLQWSLDYKNIVKRHMEKISSVRIFHTLAGIQIYVQLECII